MLKKTIALLVLACAGSLHAETYNLDPAHAEVGFKIKHMGLSNISGTFDKFDGSFTYDGSLDSLKVNGVIQVNSVNTRNAKRDAHLLNEDFFSAEEYPEISFDSSGVESSEGTDYLLGQLTIKDVTRPVKLAVEVNGPIDSPFEPGVQLLGVNLFGSILRHDFGVGHDGASDKLIGEEVTLEIHLEGKK